MSIFVVSGGGVRIGASFGAQQSGEAVGAFNYKNFQHYVGTSAGAFDVALSANGWNADQKKDLFLDTDFAKLFKPFFLPFSARKALALKWPIPLKKLASFIDSLGLVPHQGLIVNTVDSETNQHIIYCEELPKWDIKGLQDGPYRWLCDGGKIAWETQAFSRYGMGNVLTRSMALPGLVADNPKFKDGGISENPLLSILPRNQHILTISLGFAGEVEKDGKRFPVELLDEVLYAYEFKSYTLNRLLKAQFKNLFEIRPRIYDVDSTDFAMSEHEKADLVYRARRATETQWLDYRDSQYSQLP